MKERPRRARASLPFAVILLALGCGSPVPTPTAAPSPSSSTDGLTGGTLRVGMNLLGYEEFQVSEDGTTFNFVWDPQATWAPEPFEIFRCCLLRTLMSYNGRETNDGGTELRPDLAADEPTVSADGLMWTFRLKSGLKYAPPFGETPIVAGDFVRALERALQPNPFDDSAGTFTPYATYFSEVIAGADEFSAGHVDSISGLSTPDPLTLVVRLTRPAGDLGARLTLPAAAPIPPGASDGHDAGYGRFLVSSGPYMIEGSELLDPDLPPDQQPTAAGYVPGISLTLVGNPSWDRATDDLHAALAERIVIMQFDDYDLELQAIVDGDLDIALSTDLDVDDLIRLRADPQVAPRIHLAPTLRSEWITLNTAVPPFDDLHVRKAVQLVTNKAALIELLEPTAQIQAHAIPDAFSNGLLSEYDPYGTTGNAGSIEQARAEMRLSAYDSNGDGACDSTACADVYLPVRDDDAAIWAAAQAWAGQLAQLGVMLRLEATSADLAFLHGALPENRGAIGFLFGWASDYLNGSSWFEPLATGASISPGGIGNLSLLGASSEVLGSFGYEVTDVPSLDGRIASCIALTGSAQTACWAEADQYLMERVASWIPIDNSQTSRLTSSDVSTFAFDDSLAMPSLGSISVVRTQ